MTTKMERNSFPHSANSALDAVLEWTRTHGQEMTRSILYGITRAACYEFLCAPGKVDFTTMHPAIIERAFVALNVPVEIYHCRTSAMAKAWVHGNDFGEDVLIQLPACGHEGLPARGSAKFLYQWRTGAAQTDASAVDDYRWQEEVFVGMHACTAFRFYYPYMKRTSWNRLGVMRLALRQYVQQMEQHRIGTKWVGLTALDKLAEYVQGAADNTWQSLLDTATADEAGCHRALFSEYLAQTAVELGEDRLHEAAIIYQKITFLWCLVHQVATCNEASKIVDMLRVIGRCEKTALHVIREVAFHG